MGSRTRSAQKRLGGTAKEKFKTNPKSKPNQKKIYTKFPKNTQIFVPFLICILLSIYSNHTPNTYSSKHTISFTQIDKTKISNKNQKPKPKQNTKLEILSCYFEFVFVSTVVTPLLCSFFLVWLVIWRVFFLISYYTILLYIHLNVHKTHEQTKRETIPLFSWIIWIVLMFSVLKCDIYSATPYLLWNILKKKNQYKSTNNLLILVRGDDYTEIFIAKRM